MKNLLINDYRSKNRIGTNQYIVKRKKNTLWYLLIMPLLFGTCLSVKVGVHNLTAAHADYVSPLPAPTPTKDYKVLPQTTSHKVVIEDANKQQIEAYIKEVFGKDTDKAIRLLTDPVCPENGSLNPKAINYNLNDDGSTSSIDYGLFQINDHFQGFNDGAKRFLEDYKINTLMAHRIFVDSGNTFARWTCGAKLSI